MGCVFLVVGGGRVVWSGQGGGGLEWGRRAARRGGKERARLVRILVWHVYGSGDENVSLEFIAVSTLDRSKR